jgi:hypothetical protein
VNLGLKKHFDFRQRHFAMLFRKSVQGRRAQAEEYIIFAVFARPSFEKALRQFR